MVVVADPGPHQQCIAALQARKEKCPGLPAPGPYYYTPLPRIITGNKQQHHVINKIGLGPRAGAGLKLWGWLASPSGGVPRTPVFGTRLPRCPPPLAAAPNTGLNEPKTAPHGPRPRRGFFGLGPRRFVANWGRMACSSGVAASLWFWASYGCFFSFRSGSYLRERSKHTY